VLPSGILPVNYSMLNIDVKNLNCEKSFLRRADLLGCKCPKYWAFGHPLLQRLQPAGIMQKQEIIYCKALYKYAIFMQKHGNIE
jgi:hypothetical protein